jgi:hypothetical protein
LDSDPRYANYERKVGYLAIGFWPKIGESEEHAMAKAEAINKARSASFLRIFQKYLLEQR